MEPSTSSPLWLVEYNESNSAFSRLLQIVENDASRSERFPRIKIFSVLQNQMDVSELVLGYLKRAERSNITESLKQLRLLDKFRDISIVFFPTRAEGLTNASIIFSASKLYIFDKTTFFGSDPSIKYVITNSPSNCELVVYSKKNMEKTHHIIPTIPLLNSNSNSNQNGPSYHNSQNDQISQSSQNNQIRQNNEQHAQINHGYDHMQSNAAANGERKLEILTHQALDNLNGILNDKEISLNVMRDECYSVLESFFTNYSELKKERMERNVNEEEESENNDRGDKKKEKEEREKKGKRVMGDKGEEDEFEIRYMDEENEDSNGNDEEVVIVNEQMYTNTANNNDEREEREEIEERETNGEGEKEDINVPYHAKLSMQNNHHKYIKKFDGASTNLEMIRSTKLMTMAVESTLLAAEEAYKSEERMKAEMKKMRKKMKENMEKCEIERMRDKYFLQCFRCPITLEIMEDPVVASDGHTYERTAITTWLEDHTTSPTTNLPMPDAQLRENFILKALIKKWNDSEVIFNST